jgi:predicted component of type VI protein secretion system
VAHLLLYLEPGRGKGQMPKLTLVVERTAQKVYDFDGPIIRVGREMGLEVVIDNAAVSRYQAEIRRQDAQWFVRDLNSGNGTLLNGRRLDGLSPIKRGDEISFGKFSLFFDHVPTPPAPQPYAPSRTGYAEPGRTLVMRPEELTKIRAAIVEKRRAHVRWQAGDQDGAFALTDSGVVIGRGEECDLRVACRAPKRHLHITRVGQQYEVRNTSWWYRMRVNDELTRHATLRDGDEIAIGGLLLTFKDDIR